MAEEPYDVVLTRAQVREIDRLSIEQYHIPGVVLMENAARAAAGACIRLMADFRVEKVLILCGGGNNGGDGLAIARHVHNFGLDVQIALTVDPSRYKAEALVNWQIVQAMNLPVAQADPAAIRAYDDGVVVDAIFGTGLSQPPRDPFPAIVSAIADSDAPVLAVDLPSGLDCDTGEVLGPAAVVADRTVTFVLPKIGFNNPAAAKYLGEVTIGDVGCPRELVGRFVAGPGRNR